MKKLILFSVLILILILSSCSFAEPVGDTTTYIYSVNTTAHAETHEDSGDDEISMGGLSGLLADGQHVIDVEVKNAIESDAALTLLSHITGVITLNTENVLRDVDDAYIQIRGGQLGAQYRVYGEDQAAYPSAFDLFTRNAAKNANKLRVRISGAIDVATAIWSDITQSGLIIFPYLTFWETSAPDAGTANTVRMYAIQGAGDNLTDMCAVYQDGTVDIFSQETTELTSPLFTMPSGTIVVNKIVKPHAGLILFVSEYSTGEFIITRQIEYHDYDKVMANKGCEGELPKDWLVETSEERMKRNLMPVVSENTTDDN